MARCAEQGAVLRQLPIGLALRPTRMLELTGQLRPAGAWPALQ